MARERTPRASPSRSSASGVRDQSASRYERSPSRWPSSLKVGKCSSRLTSSWARLPRRLSRAALVVTRYIQVPRAARPSKLSILRARVRKTSCTTSSASASLRVMPRATRKTREAWRCIRSSRADVSPPRRRSTRTLSDVASMLALLRLELLGHERRAVGEPRVVAGQLAEQGQAGAVNEGHSGKVYGEARQSALGARAGESQLVHPGADEPPLEDQGYRPADIPHCVDLEHGLCRSGRVYRQSLCFESDLPCRVQTS